MIRWLDSVRFDQLHAAMVLAIWRAEQLYTEFGADCWLTSGNDSQHMNGSRHFDGKAVDFRVHNLPDESARETVAMRLRAALGPQFKVIYEDAGKPNAHLHCQFQGT